MFRSALFVAALLAATSANAETYAIQAGRLIVDAASPERGPSTVVVENGRIARIEDGFTTPAGATVVDQRSRTVMTAGPRSTCRLTAPRPRIAPTGRFSPAM